MPDASRDRESKSRSGRATCALRGRRSRARPHRRATRTNAVVTVVRRRTRARPRIAIDAAVARGDDPGPLAGVPFTVKDTLAAAGLRATGGQPRARRPRRRPPTPTVVARLRAAGAVLVGKTNCPEFALQAADRQPHLRADPAPARPRALARRFERRLRGRGRRRSRAVLDRRRLRRFGPLPRRVHGHLRPAPDATSRCRPTGTCPNPRPARPAHRFQTVGPLARTLRDIALVFDVLAGGRAGLRRPRLPRRPHRRSGSCGAVGRSWRPSRGALDDGRRRVRGRAATTWSTSIPLRSPPRRMCFDAWRADRRLRRSPRTRRGPRGRAHRRTSRGCSRPRRCPPTCRRRSRRWRARSTRLLATTPILVLPVSRVGVLALDGDDASRSPARRSPSTCGRS